jgi:hypothetical protein
VRWLAAEREYQVAEGSPQALDEAGHVFGGA